MFIQRCCHTKACRKFGVGSPYLDRDTCCSILFMGRIRCTCMLGNFVRIICVQQWFRTVYFVVNLRPQKCYTTLYQQLAKMCMSATQRVLRVPAFWVSKHSILFTMVVHTCILHVYIHVCTCIYIYVSFSANDPVCIIQVETLRTHTSVMGDCNLMAGIQLSNLCVSRSENEGGVCPLGISGQCEAEQADNECSFSPCSKQSASGNYANHAVIMGVLRQSDVPKSWLQPFLSYSCAGLHVPLASNRKSWLKSKPDEVLQGSVTFSREYQNLCLGLASNKLLLVSNVVWMRGTCMYICIHVLYSVFTENEADIIVGRNLDGVWCHHHNYVLHMSYQQKN